MLQTIAKIGLLTMLVYFVFVNVFNNQKVASDSVIRKVTPVDTMEITDEIKPASISVVSAAVAATEPAAFEPAEPVAVAKDGKIPQASNEDLFEKTANFGSDITNISQFYKNNPELFNRVTYTTAPDAVSWDHQSDKMHREHLAERSSILYGYNFEDNFTKL